MKQLANTERHEPRSWIWITTCGVSMLAGFALGSKFQIKPSVGINVMPTPMVEQTNNDMAFRKSSRLNSDTQALPKSVRALPQSEEEIQKREQERRDSAGERSQSQAKEGFLTKQDSARRTRYTPLLTGLGLDSDQAEKVITRLNQLHREAVTAGDAMLSLLQSRSVYDSEMRKLLSGEAYQTYRAYEEAKPYKRDLENLKQYALKHQVNVAPDTEAQLLNVLQNYNLKSRDTWDGPYDPIPSPLVGNESITLKINESMTRLRSGLNSLKQSSDWEQLPQTLSELIEQYIEQQVAAFQRSIDLSLLSEEERMRRINEYGRTNRVQVPH